MIIYVKMFFSFQHFTYNVLCRKGDSLIDGAVETLSKLRELEKKVYFVTNSSTRSREGFQKKFNQLGISVQLSGSKEFTT